ncbi:MAG: carbohydrate-binding domain-containing protein [Aeromicrobium sp.]|nr:MAG: carbohydrate-binding domain-containing protein [Aeromicrobium sp.]
MASRHRKQLHKPTRASVKKRNCSMKTPWIKRSIASSACLLVLATASACSNGTSTNAENTNEVVKATTFTSPAETHADANDGDYSTSGATTISLRDGNSSVSGKNAEVKGDTITISAGGTYVLSGTLSDGQVIVNSDAQTKVKLVLDGVEITSKKTSPIVIEAADEVVVITASGSTNTLADSAASAADDEEEDAPTATLFSMADLTLAGEGTLTVTGASNDAIGSKDGLVMLSGTVNVNATDDGVRGKDYAVVQGGKLTIKAGGDGIKSDNDNTDELGWIQLDKGTVNVAAGSQGLDAVGAVNIADGELTVSESEEGIQGKAVTIAGGVVDVNASDDGINATSHTETGGTEQVEEGVILTISGGTVTLFAGADGIDSNGTAAITGGTVAINTRSGGGGGGEGALDVNGAVTVPAGISFDASKIKANELVEVADADKQVQAEFVLTRAASNLLVLSPQLTATESFTVTARTQDDTSSAGKGRTIATAKAAEGSEFATRMGGGRQGGMGGTRPEGGQPPEIGLGPGQGPGQEQ